MRPLVGHRDVRAGGDVDAVLRGPRLAVDHDPRDGDEVAMTLIVSEVPGGVDSVAARRCSARMVIGAAAVPERLTLSVRGSAYAPSAKGDHVTRARGVDRDVDVAGPAGSCGARIDAARRRPRGRSAR
jgi:hypothetical protein